MASDASAPKSSVPLILLLLLLLVVGILILPSLNVKVNQGIQSTPAGQCQSGDQGFDERQEAFTLAQTAEQYRRANSFGGNYGLGSYTICYTDGSQQRFQSAPFQGYDNLTDTTKPKNYTHSEQAAHGWLQNRLSRMSFDQSKITAIYSMIFSQIVVCDKCKEDMQSWQRILRQKARTNALFLSIWEIAPSKGFNPKKNPAGTGNPITINDLQRVPIRFAP